MIPIAHSSSPFNPHLLSINHFSKGRLLLESYQFGEGLIITINVQNYFQLISSYKIPVKKEKTLT